MNEIPFQSPNATSNAPTGLNRESKPERSFGLTVWSPLLILNTLRLWPYLADCKSNYLEVDAARKPLRSTKHLVRKRQIISNSQMASKHLVVINSD